MTSALSDIQENIKSARENALLGSYDTSQVYYQGALQQVQKHLVSITDPARKQKWQQVNASRFLVWLKLNSCGSSVQTWDGRIKIICSTYKHYACTVCRLCTTYASHFSIMWYWYSGSDFGKVVHTNVHLVVVVEYWTRDLLRVRILPRPSASNLEQAANLLCAPANSASYPQPDREWVVAHGVRSEDLVRWLGRWYVWAAPRVQLFAITGKVLAIYFVLNIFWPYPCNR